LKFSNFEETQGRGILDGVSSFWGGSGMRSLALIAAVFLAVTVSSCGGNSTTIGVTVTPPATSPGAAILVGDGQTQTFSASVTGGSATTVYWQICLPVPITSPPTQPTMCTAIPGVTTSSTPTINGYGTITQNGVYTAPTTLPQQNPFLVVATSTVDSTAFGTTFVRVGSNVRVQMIPATATIATEETYTITASVTGTTNTAVAWSVNNIVNGNSTVGTITPGGPGCPATPPTAGQNCATFAAPTSAETATITATSSADPSQSGSSTISVLTAADPQLASFDPTVAEQGSAQQDIYVIGTDFFSTSLILVNGTAVPTTWISTTLMSATIPSTLLAQAVPLPITVQRQNGDVSTCTSPTGCTLQINVVRPAVVASSPDSVASTSAAFGVSLTGGFFAPAVTNATFNGFPGTGTGVGAGITLSGSRQMTVNIPAGGLSTPGLYPIIVQNSGLPSGSSSTSGVNIAVTPASIAQTAPIATVMGLGSTPSAIAVDQADGLAVVANTGSNSVSIISLASNSVVQTLAVGNHPTGVAVDDALLAPLDHIAVVVNSADNTVSTIDLKTNAVSSPLSLPALPAPQPGQPAPQSYSIGINPLTHRALVANASTNIATILDLSAGAPALLQQVGGTNTNYGTGPQPQISVDPRLNWAIVTAGGGGIGNVSFVDLGRMAVAGVDPGRVPSVVGTLSLSTTGTSTVAGVGVNPETHQVLLTMPAAGNFTTFSLLDQTVSTIPFTNQGVTVNQPGYVAAAVSALPNIGVAVNTNGNTASLLDLENHLVIENVTVGNGPVAVAMDPASNEALVVNQTDGTVSIVSLGPVRSSASLGASQAPQITLSSPEIAFTSPTQLTLTVNGGGFATGAQVFLDGTAVPSTVSSSGRQIMATVPPSMVSAARRFAVYVQNPGQSVISNIEDLTVIQTVSVGAQPFGVAIDTDCDVAAVTNSGDGTVSVVALIANAAPPGKTCVSAGAVGTVGAPVSVGTMPEGIAIEPLLGLAVVGNNGSNDASVVDLTETNPPSTLALCSGSCTGVSGVAIRLDTSTAYITDILNSNGLTYGNVSEVTLPSTSIPASASAAGSVSNGIFPEPVAIAIDQYLDYLGLAIAGQGTSQEPSAVQVYNVLQASLETASSGFQLPTGIVFDPVNQVFVVANSLTNNVGFVDPNTAIASFAQVGMNPTALDYNYQTSTLVTANNASQTISIVDYVCPPTIVANCSGPQVRSILGLGGSPQFSMAIDPKLNLAVLADENNNRVLLIPLP
jgi:YVTN family beta-propeller protein